MVEIEDHPLRYSLANELHARPFPALEAPARAAFLAIKRVGDAALRDRDADLVHLTALLDRFGVAHPAPGATHHSGQLGKFSLKWEQHTEFVTYTLFADGVAEHPFDARSFEAFPADWLADAPGARLTSALIRVEEMPEEQTVASKLKDWFVPESLAVSRVVDHKSIIAGDFRIDSGGHMRFAVFVGAGTGPGRVGRIVQRLCEIETYKAMSMLGLAEARGISERLGKAGASLTNLTRGMSKRSDGSEATLMSLLEISSDLEEIAADTSFRFSATKAYAAIVSQRIEVLREGSFNGRQSFGDFMMRRFDPAMRTVEATERQLGSLAARAARAADLLRTRVDVERSSQNQALLQSMDRRADLQLKLQRTVEGLSVVAISYYAVNLAGYLLAPFAEGFSVEKPLLTAGLAPVVILVVFWMLTRIRKSME